MKKHFYILFCFALLGCQNQKAQEQQNLIPESKMVRILADLHLAEAQVESTVAYPDTALMAFGKLQKEIWEKHGITEEEFRETYNYYTLNIKEMDRLYEIITDTLIAREAIYATKGDNETEIKEDDNTTDTDAARLRRLQGSPPPDAMMYDTGTGL